MFLSFLTSSNLRFQFYNRLLSTSIIPLYIIVVLEKCHIIYFSMIFIFGTYLKLRNICILFLFNRGNLISNWVKNISSQLQHTPHIINIYFITFSCYMFSWTKYISSIHYDYFKFKFHFSYSHRNTEYLVVTMCIIKSVQLTYYIICS